MTEETIVSLEPVRTRIFQTKRQNCCYECRAIIPINDTVYEYNGRFRTADDDIIDRIILCISCNDDWRLVRRRATRRYGAEHPLAQVVFGSLPNRVVAIKECGLLKDKFGRTLFNRWQRMKGAVPAKIGPRVPEAETAPTPTVLVIRAAPHRPDFKLPKPTTRQGEAAAAARRDAELIGMLEVALHTPPIGLAQDVTILKASALFALFTTELLDTKLGSNETLRFKRSKARKEIIGRFTPALLESILAHLEANPPQQTEARRGWSNLLSNLQDHLDPKHQAVPESFDDVAGWTAWAQSYLQRRCATV